MKSCSFAIMLIAAAALLLPGCATQRPPLATVEPSYSILQDVPALESLVVADDVAMATPVAQAPPTVWQR